MPVLTRGEDGVVRVCCTFADGRDEIRKVSEHPVVLEPAIVDSEEPTLKCDIGSASAARAVGMLPSLFAES